MTYNTSDGEGWQSLHANQLYDRYQYSTKSGCSVSINSGTLGNADTLTLASGEIIHNGSSVSVASQSVGISGSNAEDPRKDVVYLDSTGTAQVAAGTPEAKDPSTASRFETFRPAPLDLSGTKATVIAEVWVPAGASSITSSDLRDRRVYADLAVNSASAGKLSGAYPMDVRAVSAGGVVASIDHESKSTPISDARDAIVNNGNGHGAILYPPTTIQEEATYTQTEIGISHIGYGPRSSVVEFTTDSADGYVWDNAEQCLFTGIKVADAVGARTSGSAWRWINNAVADFNVGHVHIAFNGPDPIIHMDTGHVFSSHWDKVRLGGEGTSIEINDSWGPGMSVNNIRTSVTTSDPAIVFDDAGGSVTDCGVWIGALNIGGSVTTALKTKVVGDIIVETIGHFGNSSVTSVVEAEQSNVPTVNGLRTSGGLTADAIYRLAVTATAGNAYLADPLGGATLNVSEVEIEANDLNAPVIYSGVSTDVTNNTGATLSNPVSCLGDLTTVT